MVKNKKLTQFVILLVPIMLCSCISWIPNAYYYGIKEKGFAKSLKTKLPNPNLGKSFKAKFTSLSGKPVDTSKMIGQVILVDFYASWHPPYARNIQLMKNIYNSYKNDRIEMIGISADKNKTHLNDFISKNHIKWPQYFDGKGFQNQVFIENNVTKVQSVWLIDKNGVVVDTDALPEIYKKIEKLLSE
jgi:peroxiredoxin